MGEGTRTGSAASVLSSPVICVSLHDDIIVLRSHVDVLREPGMANLAEAETARDGDDYVTNVPLTPTNAFALRYSLPPHTTRILNGGDVLSACADRVEMPYIEMGRSGKDIILTFPPLPDYWDMIRPVHPWPLSTIRWKIPLARLIDVEATVDAYEGPLVRPRMDEAAYQVNHAPLEGYDGTWEGLENVPVSQLHVVATNTQTRKARRASNASLADKLASVGIVTLKDLLLYLPRRFDDRSHPVDDTRDLVVGEPLVVVGTIDDKQPLPGARGGVRFTVKMETGRLIDATFFNQPWMYDKYDMGESVMVSGKFKLWKGIPQISATFIDYTDESVLMPMMPIYPQSASKGITTTFICSAVREALERLQHVEPPAYLKPIVGDDLLPSLRALHVPHDKDDHRDGWGVMEGFELVLMQILIQASRPSMTRRKAVASQRGTSVVRQAITRLPFTLTGSQQQAVDTLLHTVSTSKPSTTLLHGDVGSGKTVVAALTALKTVASGHQVAMVAPTDILARQLFDAFTTLIPAARSHSGDDDTTPAQDRCGENDAPIACELLSSSVPSSTRKSIRRRVASGEVQVVIGTHAVLSTRFHDVGLVIFDEQQKFGADQRAQLLESRKDGRCPHVLMQTATPIPRSMAQVLYGDIDMIFLTDKPAGRLPVETRWIHSDANKFTHQLTNEVWDDVRTEAKAGHQTFVIAPLVADSPSVDAVSVAETFKALSHGALSGLRVGQVTGKMAKKAQQKTMEEFRRGDYDVLVASTVVEVGVDIPQATRVVVLSADRLGSSSLHQIRGRVGRNSILSRCYLVSVGATESARRRMEALVAHNDGLSIAQADLDERGEGTMFSVHQSGDSMARFVSLSRSGAKVPAASRLALDVLGSPDRECAIGDAERHFSTSASSRRV